MAFRYECSLRPSMQCGRGDGKPKTKKCRFCGGAWFVQEGEWAAFEHTGTGHYDPADAKRWFASRVAGEKWADERDLVLRWMSKRPSTSTTG